MALLNLSEVIHDDHTINLGLVAVRGRLEDLKPGKVLHFVFDHYCPVCLQAINSITIEAVEGGELAGQLALDIKESVDVSDIMADAFSSRAAPVEAKP